jgi:hypothetical protein
MHTKFWTRSLKGRGYLLTRKRQKDNIKTDMETGWEDSVDLIILLRTETNGRLL